MAQVDYSYQQIKDQLTAEEHWEEFINTPNKQNYLLNKNLGQLNWDKIQDCNIVSIVRYYALQRFDNNLNIAQEYIISHVKTDDQGNFIYTPAEKTLLNLKGLDNTAGFNYAAFIKECKIKPAWQETHFNSMDEVDLSLLGRSALDDYEKDMVLENDWEALTRKGPLLPIVSYCQNKQIVDQLIACRQSKYKYCLFSLLEKIHDYIFLIYGPNKIYEGALVDNQFRKLRKLKDKLEFEGRLDVVLDQSNDDIFRYDITQESIINSLGQHSDYLPELTKNYVKAKERALQPKDYFDPDQLIDYFDKNPEDAAVFNHLWKLISEVSFRHSNSTSYMQGKIDDAVHFRWFFIQYVFNYGHAPERESKAIIKTNFNLSNSTELSKYTTVGSLVQACTDLDLAMEDHKSILYSNFDYCPGEKWKSIMNQVPGSTQLIYLTFILTMYKDLPLHELHPTTVLFLKMLLFCKEHAIPVDTISFHPWYDDYNRYSQYVQYFNCLIKFLISGGKKDLLSPNSSKVSNKFPTNRLENLGSIVKAINAGTEKNAFMFNNDVFRPGKCFFKVVDIINLLKNIIYNPHNFELKHYKTQIEELTGEEKDLIAAGTGLNRICFDHEHNLSKKDLGDSISTLILERINYEHNNFTAPSKLDIFRLAKYLLRYVPDYDKLITVMTRNVSDIPGLDVDDKREDLFEEEDYDNTFNLTFLNKVDLSIEEMENITYDYKYSWENNPEEPEESEEEGFFEGNHVYDEEESDAASVIE